MKKAWESGECECLRPSDKGWRAFAAVFIALFIPFLILILIFGFKEGFSSMEDVRNMGVAEVFTSPYWLIIIIGMVLIFIFSLIAGVLQHKQGVEYQKDNQELLKKIWKSGECECIGATDRGWRTFAAIFIALFIPLFFITLIVGSSKQQYLDPAYGDGYANV